MPFNNSHSNMLSPKILSQWIYQYFISNFQQNKCTEIYQLLISAKNHTKYLTTSLSDKVIRMNCFLHLERLIDQKVCETYTIRIHYSV